MPRIGFGCLERPLARFFFAYGGFVTRNPYPFIVIPLLTTMALCTGLLHLSPLADAVYLFTPTDAESKMERLSIHEKWPLADMAYIPGRAVTQSREAQVSVRARHDGNVLLPEYAEAIDRLDNYIQHRVKVPFKGRNYSYSDLCLRTPEGKCPGNEHVKLISRLFAHGINITYPRFRVGGQGGYYGAALGAVSLIRNDHGRSILAGAKAWLLVYHLKFRPTNTNWLSAQWEEAFRLALDEYPEDPFIHITYFHSQTLQDELRRNADSLIPKFALSFIILVLFSVICSVVFIEGTLYIDWVLSKPLLSILGVVNACMGIATAMGICVYGGIPYNDIVAVMPFLVVAVGTDNMFLMVAAVRRTSRSDSAEQRMGDCMSDAAVSIMITALTDAFSFGVGTITTIPAVQIFCIYTCLALVLTFVYQMTFFCALLSLSTGVEGEGRHCLLLRDTVPSKLHSTTSSIVGRLLWMGSRPHPHADHPSNKKDVAGAGFFRNWYAPLLVQPAVRVLVGVAYCIYVAVSVIGCLSLREGLEPINLLVEDSYAIPHYRVLEKYFWHYGASLQVVVNNCPDLRDPSERARLRSLVHGLASTSHSIGDEGVEWWMEEMESFYSHLGVAVSNSSFYRMAEHFVAAQRDAHWEGDLVWKRMDDGSNAIAAFRLIVGMRDISSTGAQQEATRVFREAAARFPSFNVTTFMPLWLFTDQYALVVPNTVQDIVIAVSCMLLIAFLLIPQPMCALWVAFTIGSIDLGVLGFMTIWGVNLDAISMITIIMSVGFSVDYSAHIAYGYVVSKSTDTKSRVQEALGDLGWPVIQGGLSTILAVSVLADVPAYMIVTFFKTVFLAISIGLLHGLLFLPLMLSLFVGTCCTIRQEDDEDESSSPIPFYPPKPPPIPPRTCTVSTVVSDSSFLRFPPPRSAPPPLPPSPQPRRVIVY